MQINDRFDTLYIYNIQDIFYNLSSCHKLGFSNPNIWTTLCRRTLDISNFKIRKYKD